MKSARLEHVRSDLSDAYDRIQRTLFDEGSEGALRMQAMLENAQRAVDEAAPTWLPIDIATALRQQLRTPATPYDVLAAGPHGLLVFEKPVTRTSLGAHDPSRGAPVSGLAWWAATIDDDELRYDSDRPELIVVHVLSTDVGVGFPWSPALWGHSGLTDLGMFAMPVGQEMTPPSASDDDLAPAVAVLLGFGAAVREDRLIFETVPGESAATRAVEYRPRAATVLAA